MKVLFYAASAVAGLIAFVNLMAWLTNDEPFPYSFEVAGILFYGTIAIVGWKLYTRNHYTKPDPTGKARWLPHTAPDDSIPVQGVVVKHHQGMSLWGLLINRYVVTVEISLPHNKTLNLISVENGISGQLFQEYPLKATVEFMWQERTNTVYSDTLERWIAL